jgi:hypothetical protein
MKKLARSPSYPKTLIEGGTSGTGRGGVLRGYRYQQPEREGYRAASECVVAEGLAVSLDKPLEWSVGFFFGNVELSLELWTVIAGISGFDDY